MATIYIPDDVLMRYAAKHGGPSEAKAQIQDVVEENAPEENDG